MDRRLIPLLALAIVWPARLDADEFRSQTFGCHATFPGKHVTAQERLPVGWLMTELQEEPKGTYALSGFSLPGPIPPDALDKALSRTRSEMVASRGYTLVSPESRRKLDGRHPGVELVLEKKQSEGEPQRIRMRLYFVDTPPGGTRVYQIQVSGAKDWTETDEATKFLDSFGLNG